MIVTIPDRHQTWKITVSRPIDCRKFFFEQQELNVLEKIVGYNKVSAKYRFLRLLGQVKIWGMSKKRNPYTMSNAKVC